MEIPLLQDIAIILGLSLVVLLISYQFKIPTIVGLLITGVLLGPYGLRLITSIHEVEALAEVGVVLLLFTIGLEFSFSELFRLKKTVFLGGSLQVGLTIILTTGIVLYLGEPLNKAIFIGFLIALSSTAIVLKIFQEKAEVETPHDQTALALLIFQDFIVVLMMLLPPILSGQSENLFSTLLVLLLKGMAVIVFVIISARYVVPPVLYQIARTRSRELFLLSICAIALAVAWLTSSIGLSLGLGAFMAGLIISESEFSLEALGGIRPFRDVFTSFFFVSIGMLLNIQFFFDKPLMIFLLAFLVMALKMGIVFSVCWILRFQFRTALIAGLSLCQIGEFSFILSQKGLFYGLLSKDTYQIFLSVSVITMVVTPFLINAASRISDIMQSLPGINLFQKLFSIVPIDTSVTESEDLENHLIIVGFGENGKLLVRSAKAANIPYIIIEMNAETVKNQRKKGELILYGDATNEALLTHSHITDARVMVVAIYDPVATRQIVKVAKRMNPGIHIIARTRFVSEVEALYESGADEVIPAEFETAVEIFTRTLRKFLIPRNEIEGFVRKIRADGYKMLRSLSILPYGTKDLGQFLTDTNIEVFRIDKTSPFTEKSIAEIGLRKSYGVTIIAIRRLGETISNPDAEVRLSENDHVVIIGKNEHICETAKLFAGDNACTIS